MYPIGNRTNSVFLILVLKWIYPLSNFKLKTLPVLLRWLFFNILILMRFIKCVRYYNLKLIINRIKIKILEKSQRSNTANVLKLKFDTGQIHSNIKRNNTEMVLLNVNLLFCA